MTRAIYKGCATNTTASRRRKRTAVLEGIADMKTYICKRCGKEYIPKASDRITYCSRECAFAYRREHPKSPKPRTIIACPVCGTNFERKRGQIKFCSEECRRKDLCKRDYERNKRKFGGLKRPFICKWCGKEFMPYYGIKKRAFCSKDCTERHGAWHAKVLKRIQDKNKVKGNFSRLAVFKRDAWVCKICGQPVVKDVPHMHPLEATIDHIIPLSKGGEHSWDNVQCTHRRCNRLKGNMLPAASVSSGLFDYRPMRG